jgi:hypothetical protein
MFDPRDYIDPDEGRPVPFYTQAPHACGNCGRPCAQTWYVPGFDYWGCDDCVAEAKILVYAEDNCPVLYGAIMRSRSVREVQRAFREHKETCPKCNPKLIPLRKLVTPACESGAHEKERAA